MAEAGMPVGERGTTVVAVDPDSPAPAAIARAAEVIRRGGLVAFPTETVYGLGANALDAEAVAGIFAAKGRPADDPLIVHLAAADQIARVAAAVPAVARALADRFWPGPLTLVLAKRPEVPAAVTAGLPSVAVRVPAHPVARALLRASGVPIAAPSANLFSRPSPTRAEHVLADLAGRIDLVLDGGPTPVGVESTIVDLTVEPPRLLRPGGITREALAEALGHPLERHAGQRTGPQLAPGMLLRHYAPRASLVLFIGDEGRLRAAIADRARELMDRGRRVGLLLADEDELDLAAADARRFVVERVGPRGDLAAVARGLFAAIRRLDRAGVDDVLARDFGEAGLGATIRDRLTRAAEGRIVEV